MHGEARVVYAYLAELSVPVAFADGRRTQSYSTASIETKSDEIGYTFHNDANLHFSLIDHFLCSQV